MLFKIDKKPESGFRAYSANKGADAENPINILKLNLFKNIKL